MLLVIKSVFLQSIPSISCILISIAVVIGYNDDKWQYIITIK